MLLAAEHVKMTTIAQIVDNIGIGIPKPIRHIHCLTPPLLTLLHVSNKNATQYISHMDDLFLQYLDAAWC